MLKLTRSFCLTALVLSGCPQPGAIDSLPEGSEIPTIDAAPVAVPTRYQVTVVSATVDGKMANGSQWDTSKTYSMPRLTGLLNAYLQNHPVLQATVATIGEPVMDGKALRSALKGPEADPMAFVQIGNHVFRSPAIARAFQPLWNFSFVVELDPGSKVNLQITLVDWDGTASYDVLGTTLVSAKELIESGTMKIERFGNVGQLILKVAPAEITSADRRLVVPGRPKWTDTGVNAMAGQTIIIHASGQVCIKNKQYCDYPDGRGNIHKEDASIPSANHGALVGALGDVRFMVGRELTFVAPASGRLYLGVNDNNNDDNTGAFDVRVQVR